MTNTQTENFVLVQTEKLLRSMVDMTPQERAQHDREHMEAAQFLLDALVGINDERERDMPLDDEK